MVNNGEGYEKFVQRLMQAIIDSEPISKQKNILVRQNEKIPDRFGTIRQFDVLWDYELGGITYHTVIECKDYNSPISIEKIDALKGKLDDFPGVRGIIATTKGYQKGAKEKAEHNNIELLCVREQDEREWKAEDGTPLVKKVQVNMVVLSPPEIFMCNTFLDKDYIEQNHIDISQVNFSNSLNTEVIIEDLVKNEKYSLYELQNKIASPSDTYGEYEKEINYENAFIFNKDIRIKLKKLHIKYRVISPRQETFEIDFSKELAGVVEYLSQGKKKIVFRNGQVRTEDITKLPRSS